LEPSKIKVSDFVIDFLYKKGIKQIYTVSGGGCMHLIDSVGKSDMDYLCTHHEQAASMAAEAHSRLSGHSAVLVTTGPGGTNTLTGLLGNWLDSIPVFYISGQVPTNQLSRGTGCRQIGDQEFDIVSVVKGMTKYSVMVENKNDILYHLEKAFQCSVLNRPGPVWVDIPLNIQGSYIDEKDLKKYTPPQEEPQVFDVEKIKHKILSAKKPVIVVGSGIRRSNAVGKLRNFLENNKLPVMTGPHSGIDIVNDDYENYLGRFGVLGQVTSNKLIQEADLILCIGSRLNVKMTGYDHKAFAPNAYKVIVDIDENEMNKFNIIANDKIKCDALSFLNQMGDEKITGDIDEWLEYTRKFRTREKLVLDKHRNKKDYVSSYCFVESLCRATPEDCPIVTSDGTAHVVTLKTAKLKGNQRLFTNVGCASMGYGLPAAIGACNAINRKQVVCIEGDGSIQMNIQELQTLVHHEMPIKLFVINNDGYLSIRLTQDSFFDSRYVAIDESSGVSFPDMEKLAKAYGIKYFSIRKNKDIDFTISQVMSYDNEPVICEIFTDPQEKHEPKVMAQVNSDGSFKPGKLESITWG
jgi:acetolactate synthase I/II/III large subunit